MEKIKILVKKEVMDILRDKKTLIVMVLVPVLLYPLIIIGMSLVMSMLMQSQEDKIHTVSYSYANERIAEELERLYTEHEDEIGVQMEFAADASDADVSVEIAQAADGTQHFTLHYDSTDETSDTASYALEKLLEIYREELLEKKLKQQGLDENFLYPVTYESQDSASLTESFGMDVGGSIGMMLIVTILLGAVYPAIDATAGEKERGTLETLLTLPVTNFQMIMSKYLSVALFACVTAVISLLSLGGSVLFLIFGISDGMAKEIQSISLPAVLPLIPVLLLTMLVTALFATALCMCFCVFAKSFKEANNYVTPVMLIVMFASMVAMVPTVKLDYRTALIPIVNVSLMIKQIISMQFDLSLAGITIGVNLGYSILIVWILSKMYDSENVLFSDGFASFRLFQKRSEIKRGTVPDMGDLVISITVLLLLILYVGTVVSVRLGFWGTAVNQLLILAVPLLAAWYLKSDMRSLFSLHVPEKGTLAGSVLLYIGAYSLMMALSSVLMGILPESTQNLEESFRIITEQPLPVLLLVTAVMPAVGEELLFRGFLFGSLQRRIGLRWGILISALVFGAFHMSLVKLLPTAILGASFSYIVFRSGSLYVTSVLHCLNNTVSMLALKYPEQAAKVAPLLTKEQFSAGDTVLLAAAGILCGTMGLWLLRRKSSRR